jgi:hypothetical protein
MGNYYKETRKIEGALRPVPPKDFVLTDGMLMWDDTDAVYSHGAIEFSKDKEIWDTLCNISPDDGRVEALPGKYFYRIRVSYNWHWSIYVESVKTKAVKEPEATIIKKTTKNKK